ncbi:MAG TPA: helix-turn-helix transcriptional regulator [Polyangiaceae bacterium]|nr:helix-turn-helix transcriptional regulator [Polyangiaceae bacterium]
MFTTDSATALPFLVDPRPLQVIANDVNSLRQDALASDAASSKQLPLARLWLELVSGSCKIAAALFSRTHCSLVVTMPIRKQARPLKHRARTILESVLRGSAQKAVALDLGLAASTITANAQQSLERLGFGGTASRVHPLLILAATAAGEHDESVTGALSFVTRGQVAFRVVSIPRPETKLSFALPPAELEIVRCLVEGHSHDDMARQRGTSKRTVANQIASLFRRLRVTGRMELVHRLFALNRTCSSRSSSHGARALTA